jgi:hypothetical protein
MAAANQTTAAKTDSAKAVVTKADKVQKVPMTNGERVKSYVLGELRRSPARVEGHKAFVKKLVMRTATNPKLTDTQAQEFEDGLKVGLALVTACKTAATPYKELEDGLTAGRQLFVAVRAAE